MNDEQITALAREYAEEEYKTLNLPTDHTEVSAYRYMDFARFLLRRYCIVEKSKIREAYKDAQKDQYNSEGDFALTLAGRNRSAVLMELFPDLGKEVE